MRGHSAPRIDAAIRDVCLHGRRCGKPEIPEEFSPYPVKPKPHPLQALVPALEGLLPMEPDADTPIRGAQRALDPVRTRPAPRAANPGASSPAVAAAHYRQAVSQGIPRMGAGTPASGGSHSPMSVTSR